MAILHSAASILILCRAEQSSFSFTYIRLNNKNKYVVELTTTKNFVERAQHLGVRYYDSKKLEKNYESDGGLLWAGGRIRHRGIIR